MQRRRDGQNPLIASGARRNGNKIEKKKALVVDFAWIA